MLFFDNSIYPPDNMAAEKKDNKLAFLSMPAPASYVWHATRVANPIQRLLILSDS